MRNTLLYLSAVLACQAQTGPDFQLTMKRAVELALGEEGNPKLQISREYVVQAQKRSTQARSALLPSLDVSAGAENLTRNLAILGLTTSTLGFPVLSRVGPLSVSDARVSFGQSVLDLPAIYRYRAAKVEVTSTQLDSDAAAEQVAADVAQCYLAVLRCSAHVEAGAANLELAKSVSQSAQNHLQAGDGTGLDVTRANLRVAEEEQKLLQAKVERRRAERLLLRAAGLRLDLHLQLTDTLAKPPQIPAATDAFTDALRARPDWKAQQEKEQRASLAAQSAHAESLPSVHAFADYGATGASPLSALATYTAGVSLQVSVFDGGRRRSHAQEIASQVRQEKTKTADLREQIKFDIEIAADQWESAGELLAVAETALQTAERTFAQVQRRYKEGVADHLMVAEAQTELARARDSRIAALYSSNVAWVDFYRASGRLRGEITGR